MDSRIGKNAKGYAEPIKDKPGSFRLYFSLGKDPSTGKYRRSKKRTFHCRSKNPKNWPAEYRKALDLYIMELEGINEMPNSAQTLAEYATDFHTLRKTVLKSPPCFRARVRIHQTYKRNVWRHPSYQPSLRRC